MRAVLDASAIVEYLFSTKRAGAVREVVEDAAADLHVPALCDAEVLSAVRRLVLQARVTPPRGAAAIESYLQLPLEREVDASVLGRAFDLRDNFGAFDAVYAALAELQDAVLVTADDRLATAVRTHLTVDVIDAS